MSEIFIQLSVILLVVLAVSFIMRFLKQPLIIAYIISGIIVGPFALDLLKNHEFLAVFSELGVAFLLFMVGLHLSPKVIKEVGKISLIIGIGQVLFTAIFGFFICLWLNFDWLSSLYLAVALTFSSTIIIMKLLSDKDALEKLYGKISIGFLLVQDLIAILILIVISSFLGNADPSKTLLSISLKLLVIGIVVILPLYFILPRLGDFFAKSQEILFVFALAFGLGMATLFSFIGFSIEVGALIAGILLSTTTYSNEISSKLRPLRDFFIISFFILLGSQMMFGKIEGLIIPAIVLSLFILVGNSLIVMILMGIFGYSKNTGFMCGLTVAQISEFSIILIALGVKVGHLSSEILLLTTIVGLITIAGSTYLIVYSEKIYSLLSPWLSIFEKKKLKKEKMPSEEYNHILLGENRIGFSIMRTFKGLKKNYVVVDFNPERVKKLRLNGINCVYGDVSNVDFLEDLKIDKAKLVVSTIPEIETNLMIINKIRSKKSETIIIVTGRQISEVFELYRAGADYVILPHFLGGEYTSNIIEKFKDNKKLYLKEKKKHIMNLRERLKEGQEHPKIEKD